MNSFMLMSALHIRAFLKETHPNPPPPTHTFLALLPTPPPHPYNELTEGSEMLAHGSFSFMKRFIVGWEGSLQLDALPKCVIWALSVKFSSWRVLITLDSLHSLYDVLILAS